jgi:hypothetical protein
VLGARILTGGRPVDSKPTLAFEDELTATMWSAVADAVLVKFSYSFSQLAFGPTNVSNALTVEPRLKFDDVDSTLHFLNWNFPTDRTMRCQPGGGEKFFHAYAGDFCHRLTQSF